VDNRRAGQAHDMLTARRALRQRNLRQLLSNVHVLSVSLLLFACVQMCILGDAGVEVEYHDEMMSDEKQAEADESFLEARGFVYMIVACGNSGRGRVAKASNIFCRLQKQCCLSFI
jgi:phosphoribosylformylglycinamidine (FGAM) synthase-like enzyme